MMPCLQCAQFISNRNIRTPKQLEDLLTLVGNALKQKILMNIPDKGSEHLYEPFSQEAWLDIYNHHFSCTACAKRFELVAETYHGMGGHWQQLLTTKEF